MSDAIDKILDGEAELPVLMATDQYLFEIMDRIGARVHSVLRDLPVVEEVDDEHDEYLKTQEYQTEFQAGGEQLLPAFHTLSKILNTTAPALASTLLIYLMRKPGISTYWGFINQHTDVGQFRSKLG